MLTSPGSPEKDDETLAWHGIRLRPRRALDLDQPRCGLDAILIHQGLDPSHRTLHMDAIYILLVLALFASSLAFVRLCERV